MCYELTNQKTDFMYSKAAFTYFLYSAYIRRLSFFYQLIKHNTMKTLFLGLILGIVCLFSTNVNAQNTFSNGCSNSDLFVRFWYSPNPCNGQAMGNSFVVNHGTSHTFPAPPAGTHYFKCEAFIVGSPGTCLTPMGTVILDVPPTTNGCNGPDYDAFGCPSVPTSVDMWISDPGLFDVECDGN